MQADKVITQQEKVAQIENKCVVVRRSFGSDKKRHDKQSNKERTDYQPAADAYDV